MKNILSEKQKNFSINLIEDYISSDKDKYGRICFLEGTKAVIETISEEPIELVSLIITIDGVKLKFDSDKYSFDDDRILLSKLSPMDINKIVSLIDTNSINYYFNLHNENGDYDGKCFNNIDDARKFLNEYAKHSICKMIESNHLINTNNSISFNENSVTIKTILDETIFSIKKFE